MRPLKLAAGVLALWLGGAAVQPPGLAADPAAQVELDALMQRWITALLNEDLEGMLECYWPDAVSISYDPAGWSELLEGTEAIRRSQEAVFAEYDYPSLGLVYPEPARFFPQTDSLAVYVYNCIDFRFIDVFYFEERSGELRIRRHVLLVDPHG
ncbi:MAG: hypothetical protein JW820_03685 [Spirochaetales bacterium]|nr:hypothetical protein [Spirochaetales bacterium]